MRKFDVSALPVPAGGKFAFVRDSRHTAQHFLLAFAAPPSVSGAALELVCSLLERGTLGHPSMREYAAFKAELYGLSSGWRAVRQGEAFRLAFSATFVAPQEVGGGDYHRALKVFFRESLREPLFLDGSFDRELFEVDRANLVSWLREMETQPAPRAVRRAFSLALEGDEFSRPASGTVEEAEKLELDDIRELFARVLRDARLWGASAGPMAGEEVARLLGVSLSPGKRTLDSRWKPFRPAGGKRSFRESGAGESDQVLVFFAPDTAARFTRAEFGVAMGVFATGSSSRVFRAVREEMGIAYGHELMRSFEKRLAAVHSAVLPGRGEEAAARIREEMRKAGLGVEEEELAVLKREMRSAALKQFDSPSGLAERLLRHLLAGRRPEDFDAERIIRSIERVSPKRAARVLSYFRPFADYVCSAPGGPSIPGRPAPASSA